MSYWGPVRAASEFVAAPSAQILTVLMDARSLPTWNPAMGSVTPSGPVRVGQAVPMRIKGIPGQLTYDRIDPTGLQMSLGIPGWQETGVWELIAAGPGTQVTHSLRQSGPLAALFERATEPVAALRLARLIDYVSLTT